MSVSRDRLWRLTCSRPPITSSPLSKAFPLVYSASRKPCLQFLKVFFQRVKNQGLLSYPKGKSPLLLTAIPSPSPYKGLPFSQSSGFFQLHLLPDSVWIHLNHSRRAPLDSLLPSRLTYFSHSQSILLSSPFCIEAGPHALLEKKNLRAASP